MITFTYAHPFILQSPFHIYTILQGHFAWLLDWLHCPEWEGFTE